jgi:hypothetical protein
MGSNCIRIDLQDTRKLLWTKDHSRRLACSACANMQRPCIIIDDDRVLILLLHFKLQDSFDDTVGSSTKIGMWIAKKKL